MNVINAPKIPRQAVTTGPGLCPDICALTQDAVRGSRLTLCIALLAPSLMLAPAAFSAQSLDAAVNSAVEFGCGNLDPVSANLASFCSNGGAADSSTGGTTTSQIGTVALDKVALDKQGATRDDLARVDLGPVSAFLSLDFEFHEKGATDIEGRGFESDGTAVLAGVDYQVNDNFSLGVAVNYATVDGDFDGEIQDEDSGGFDNTRYGLAVIGEYGFATNAYMGWSLGYNNHEYETDRYSTVTMGGGDANGVLESETDASEINAGFELGYDMPMSALTVGPRFALRYRKTDIDGYTERVKSNNPSGTDDPLALIVDEQTEKSLTSHLGMQLSKAISWDYGVLVPQLYLDYVHEFEDDQRDIKFSFVGDDPSAGNTFIYNNDAPDRNYGHVLVGLASVSAGGLQSFISYERLLAYSDHDNDRFSVGVRLEF
ncbi:autotransporter outer membrane beta-barrel domain-containing protein [Marinobacter sp.]|uniref:autotransporter outer membrane beta-barrel domain-containing protein n=1 Tax=Marinobacter sp. TaxID=50741 RepID=UPI00384DA15B